MKNLIFLRVVRYQISAIASHNEPGEVFLRYIDLFAISQL